jgi:Uma2 family endonuclease
MTVHRRYTSADLDTLPDIPGVRYEIIDGELYVSKKPTWDHDYAAHEAYRVLQNWSLETGLGVASTEPGVVFAEDDDVIPDVIWISRERMVGALDRSRHLSVAPELVVEVLSPGAANVRRDREVKLGLYSRRGVLEYWIVDWQQRTVDVYRHDGQELRPVGTLRGDATLTSPWLPGFSCLLTTLWWTDV